MKNLIYSLLLLLIAQTTYGQSKTHNHPLKNEVIAHVDQNFSALTSLSDMIWSFEEVAFEEMKSSKTLSDYAEKQGFKVTRGVAEMAYSVNLMHYLACHRIRFHINHRFIPELRVMAVATTYLV